MADRSILPGSFIFSQMSLPYASELTSLKLKAIGQLNSVWVQNDAGDVVIKGNFWNPIDISETKKHINFNPDWFSGKHILEQIYYKYI